MILSTLDIDYYKKQTITYFLISIFCFIFSRIYEIFSHGVYSKYMMNAFLIPLIFGFIVSLILLISKNIEINNRISINLYNASIATFTIYSIFRGVLEIYGTTNNLINIYLYIGTILMLLSIIICIYKYLNRGNKNV